MGGRVFMCLPIVHVVRHWMVFKIVFGTIVIAATILMVAFTYDGGKFNASFLIDVSRKAVFSFTMRTGGL
jgi:hypothetical protein